MITDIPILHLSTSGCMGRLHPDVSAPDTRMYGNKTYQLIDLSMLILQNKDYDFQKTGDT